MKLSHIAPLDGVRATAALMVLFFHFFQIAHFDSSLGHLVQKIGFLGQTGVSLFFVLSGFLITRILLIQKKNPQLIIHFFIRRSLRILPLYVFYLFTYYYILPYFLGNVVVDFSYQWYYWFYLQDAAITFNWPSIGPKHFWSLAVEEHFYIFWPFIVKFNNKNVLILWIISIILLSTFTRYILTIYGLETYYFTLSRLDEISLGSLLAIIENKGLLFKVKSRIVLLSLIFTVLGSAALWITFSGDSNPIIQIVKYQLFSAIYFLLIWYIIISPLNNPLIWVLNSIVFRYTGKISYGIYVFQAVAVELSRSFTKGNNLVMLLILVISCYTLATISYFMLEKPALSFKNKLTPQPAQ